MGAVWRGVAWQGFRTIHTNERRGFGKCVFTLLAIGALIDLVQSRIPYAGKCKKTDGSKGGE